MFVLGLLSGQASSAQILCLAHQVIHLLVHSFIHSCISERALLFCTYCEIPWLTFHCYEGLSGEVSMTANTTDCPWCCPTCRWSPSGQLRTEAAEVLFTMDKTLKNVFHILSKWKPCCHLDAILCYNQRNERISGVFSISTSFDFFFFLYTQLKNSWALLFWKNIGPCSPDLDGIFIYVAWMAAYNPYTSKWISQNWRQSMACSILEIFLLFSLHMKGAFRGSIAPMGSLPVPL